jgi:RecA-family ATPase
VKSADAIVTLIELARGERRYSLESRETEEVLNIALALLSELAVAFDRIDRLERVVSERLGLTLAELRAIDYAEGPAAQEREDAMNALIARVLRIRLDPRTRTGDRT